MSDSGSEVVRVSGQVPETVRTDGVVWRVCPIGGYGCFRVLNDAGLLAKDVIAVHVEVSHELPSQLSAVRQLISPPPDVRSKDAKLWTRKKGA